MKKILIGSVHPWNSPALKAGDHHYAELFVKDGYPVFWMSHHVSIPHLFGGQNSIRLKNAFTGVRHINGVFSYTPFTLLPSIRIFPFNTTWAGKHHLRFAIPPITRVLKSRGFGDVDVLFISNPSLFYLTQIVQYKRLVLRIVDDLGGLGKSAKSLLDLQSILIQKADHIFVTSRELMKYNTSNKKNFWYSPNAVDPQHFSGQFPLPQEYRNIPSPRILYVGSLFQRVDRVDMDLILAAARALPLYNFVFIGPAQISVAELKDRGNIFLLGPRSYQNIPAYMKHANVAIIPFKQNALTKSMSALKLFQYLASGLPVVSTKMHELETMNPPVYFTNNNAEFTAALKEANLKGKDHAEFLAFAEQNSWAVRYKNMMHILGL